MRVHTSTIINIETGKVLQDDSFEYFGTVAYAGGKAPKPANPPPPSQEEIEQRQLSNLSSKAAFHSQGFEVYKDDSGSLALRPRALTSEEQEEADFMKEVSAYAREQFKLRPGQLSPEQEKGLEDIYGAERSKMDEELARFAVEQSGARGLSLGDTPLAREVLLAKGRGETELGASKAQAKLNFGERERLFAQGMGQWRQDLQQQKLANLMGTGQMAGQTATGFMGARGNLRAGGSAGSPSQVGGIVGGVGAAVGGIAMAL